LSHVPPSASLDEASIGYNAYSVLHTGADEYGNKFPLLLRAYDDWRPALYVYLVIPFVKFFGLSVASVRLPSVILSLFSVLCAFGLVREIFISRKDKDLLAVIATALFSISPWHIYLSRLGHEGNAGLSFGIFGLYFFFKFINSKVEKYLYVSSFFFAFSFISYQSEKIFIPLIVLILVVLYFKALILKRRVLFAAILIGLAITLPFLKETFSPNGLIRFSATSAFVNNPAYDIAAKTRLIDMQTGNRLGVIMNNQRIVTFKIFAQNYISHFNPSFLFQNSGKEDFKAPNTGLLYYWELPLILLGIFYLLYGNFEKKVKLFIFSWILISPLSASITTGAPHALRSYNFLPVWQILSAVGFISLLAYLKNKTSKKIIVGLFLIMYAASILYFFRNYFIEFPKQESSSFQYSLSKTIPFALKNQSQYSSVVFSNKDALYQSYMFFLFYS